MPRLNVMGELRGILESALGGVPVQVCRPGERPGTVVVVRRCRGSRIRLFQSLFQALAFVGVGLIAGG